MLSGAFFVWQKGQIFVKTVFPNGHDRVLCVLKKKYQGRGDAFVTVCKIVAQQLALPNEPLGDGMIIVIRHGFSM